MVEHVRLEMPKVSFLIAFSGKYSYLMGDSGIGKTLLSNSLYLFDRARAGRLIGDKKVYGGSEGFAFTHYRESDCVMVIDDDMDSLELEEYRDIIDGSPGQFIFISREPLPGIPFTRDNVFTMIGGPKEFSMVPYHWTEV